MKKVNMHCHSSFSYNALGWAPEKIVKHAKAADFSAVGLVDFDVLDGVDAFLAAAQAAEIPAIAGMETRVFIAEFSDKEINSPGEPGIAYHLGVGFKKTIPSPFAAAALARTRMICERVNAALPELALDFEKDVLPLTPAGNPTERHLCEAYGRKAFGTRAEVAWENDFRKKYMKKGGVGYIAPTPEAFPSLEEFNAFVKSCGAIPCPAWLNGFSGGESDPKALLKFHKERGAEAITIIPDRNLKDAESIANLNAIVSAARELALPVLVGTELNTPGQKLVDDFAHPALAPLAEGFINDALEICERFR